MSEERRVDLAREIGALSEQVKQLAKAVEAMSAKMNEFVALENRMKGAKWVVSAVAGAMASFLAFAWWALSQVEKLLK